MNKTFKLSADQIKPLAEGYGSCLASDRITVSGKHVGYMYREEPDNYTDSGWRFFAGDESQDFADSSNNFEIFDVNTIANYAPEIIAFLGKPAGTAWVRSLTGTFEAEPFTQP